MKRWGVLLVLVSTLATTLVWSLPSEAALCWGSLYVLSRSTRSRNRCPTPTLTKTWRLRCYDGCGYTDGTFKETLTGSGDCFKEDNCRSRITCLPVAGSEFRGFNPPSLSASILNREGYAAYRCDVPSCRTDSVSTMTVYCPCDRDLDPVFCAQNDPLIVSLRDGRYRLTDQAGGVTFDLGDSGVPGQVPWTHPQSDEAFLVLDRNGNGVIDNGTELFGDVTPQHASDEPNGFLALAVFDDVLSGGNEDSQISAADEIYLQLGLWRDANHNGVSEGGEILTLEEAGLEWIDLDYAKSGRVDRYGNQFRYRAESGWSNGGVRSVWNVFLVAQ